MSYFEQLSYVKRSGRMSVFQRQSIESAKDWLHPISAVEAFDRLLSIQRSPYVWK